ncbi:MAG TPA: hypothetical protein VF546_18245 [Pyrinomonadaceae bacterium]|jgi:hypothetical protein
MIKANGLTFIALALLAASTGLSFVTLSGQVQPPANSSQQKKPKKDGEEVDKKQFPIVEIGANAAGPPESTMTEERREKNKRYDGYRLVRKHSSTEIDETVMDIPWQERVPALPVEQSAAIIIGEIREAKAYLSNDKSGVYTEITIRITELLKADKHRTLTVGETLSADRPGGRVKYQNQHTRLYRVFGMNIPEVGRRYVLFLADSDQSPSYQIITGYELTPTGVSPLDVAPHFNAHQGEPETSFLQKVRTAIENPD